MKRTAAVNVRMLLILAVTVGLVGVGLVGAHAWRKRTFAERALAAGLAANDAQDWANASKQLRLYLSKYPDDEEILDTYAGALLQIRPYTAKNVSAAISAYRRLLRKFRPADEAICEQLARLYTAMQNYEECAYVCRTRLAKEPSDRSALFFLANALMRRQQRTEAAGALEQLIDAHPDHVRAFVLRAQLGLEADSVGGVDEASRWLDRAVDSNPASAEALVARARFHRERRQDAEQAQADLTAAVALEPSDPGVVLAMAEEWLRHAKLDEAGAALEKIENVTSAEIEAVDLVPTSFSRRQFMARASLALQLKQFEECGTVADLAIAELDEEALTLFLPIAVELYLQADRTQDSRNAVERYRNLVEDASPAGDSRRHQLLVMDAAVLLAEQQPAAAAASLSELLLEIPDYASAWRLLWTTCEQTGQSERAVRVLEHYLKRQPRDTEATLALARAHRSSDPQTALRWARMAERMLPQSSHAKVYRIQARLRVGALSNEQVAGLVADTESLVEALPNDSSAHLVRALAAVRTGDVNSALERLEHDVAMFDDAEDVLIGVARYHVRNHDVQRAIELMHRQVARRPGVAAWRIALAEFQDRAGRIDAAEETLALAAQEVDESEKNAVEFATAEFLLRNARTAEGIDRLKQLARSAPNDLRSRLRLLAVQEVVNDVSYTEQLINELREAEGEGGLRWRVEQASHWIRTGAWASREDEIRDSMDRCSRLDPGWSAPVLVLGRLHLLCDDVPAAERLYRETLGSYTNETDVAAALVVLLGREGRFDEADAILDQLPRSDSDLIDLRVGVAIGRGELEHAIAALLEGANAGAPDSSSLVVLARLIYTRRNDAATALDLLDRAHAAAPESLEVQAVQADILNREGRFDEAIALLNATVERRGDFSAQLLRAEFLERAGKLDAAEREFRALVGLGGATCDGHLALGRFLSRAGRVAEAQAVWQDGLAESPADPAIGKALAAAWSVDADAASWRKALELLEGLAAEHPDDPELLTLLARLLSRNASADDLARARSLVARAVDINPRHVPAWISLAELTYQTGDRDGAFQTATDALAKNPGKVSLRLLVARLELGRGNLGVARGMARTVLDEQPTNVAANGLFAQVLLRAGDLAEAERYTEAALGARPEDAAAQLTRAKILEATNRAEEAIEGLEAFRTMPAGRRNLVVLVELARLYTDRGQFDLAEEQLRQADLLNAAYRPAFLQHLSLAAARRQFERILPALASWRINHPEDLQAVVHAAALLASAGDPALLEKARLLFAEVRDSAPNRKDGILGLALATYQLGDAATAATYYRQVLDIDAYDRQAMNDLAWILAAELDQPNEAIQLADRAVGRYPDDATILDTRGVAFMMVGRLSDARADLERCISLENEPSLTKTAALVHLGDVLVQLNEAEEARARLLEARVLDREHSTLDGATRSRLEELIGSLP